MTSTVAIWREFLHRYYKDQIRVLGVADSSIKILLVDYSTLRQFNVKLAEELIHDPDRVLKDAEEAFSGMTIPCRGERDKKLRIVNLPVKTRIRDLRGSHVQTLVSIDCIVKNVSVVHERVVEAAFECARCQDVTYILQTGTGKFLEPAYCQCNENKKGVFRFLFNESTFRNYQRMRVQELTEDLNGGEQPEMLLVNLEDDLVGNVTPGEHIIVNGILRSQQRVDKNGKTEYFDHYLDAISIEQEEQEFEELEITPEDEKRILEYAARPDVLRLIINSIAPGIAGHDDAKMGIALQLFGGVRKYNSDGTTIRGDIHILLVGDPSTGKSHILQYVSKFAPRSMYASGQGASGAGLTAAAVKDDFDNQWTGEGGVMVLCNKGIACLDEFFRMRREDREKIHTAMEQQIVKLDKANLHLEMRSECSVLAAANPEEGRWDPSLPVLSQLDADPTLLSRFDLIYVFVDKPEKEKDKQVSRHILESHRRGERRAKLRDEKSFDGGIPLEVLRKYIAYARRKIFPELSEDAMNVLQEYYLELRAMGDGQSIPLVATHRQLEGLIRLSEASARIHLRDMVLVEDANTAIAAMQDSMAQTCKDELGSLDVDYIELGLGRDQRERMKIFKQVIRELSEGGNAPYGRVLEALQGRGYSRDRIEKTLKIMKTLGDIWEPEQGFLQLC